MVREVHAAIFAQRSPERTRNPTKPSSIESSRAWSSTTNARASAALVKTVASQLARERGAVPSCIVPEFGGVGHLPDNQLIWLILERRSLISGLHQGVRY